MSHLNVAVPSDIDAWPYQYIDNPISEKLKFIGPDNQDLYSRNLKYLSENWIYRTEEVEYNFNDQRLRMKKNLNEISDSYVLFSGTSYGMGIGIKEEDRYSEKVSKELGLDFINYCGPTYTTRMQIISFFNLLKSNFPLPKILVIEYPLYNGHTYYSDGNFLCFHENYFKHLKGYEKHLESYKILNETDNFINEANIQRNMLQGTCKRLGIKFIEISFCPDDRFVLENNILSIDPEYKDGDINEMLARDVRIHNGKYSGHPGRGIHQNISERILNLL